MERRAFIKHGLTGVVGLGAGFTLVNQSTTNASAAVSVSGLSISDASKTINDGTPTNIKATVSGDWEYKLPAGKSPDTWVVTLSVTDGENVGTVGKDSGNAMYLTNNNSWSIEGSITDTDVYDTSDFAAPENKVKTVTMGFVVLFEVISDGGDLLARSTLEDTAEVEITNQGYQATEYGTVNGNGEVVIESD